MVDFGDLSNRTGTLLLVKPGQVQQVCLNPSISGQLFVIDPSFLRPRAGRFLGSSPRLWWATCTTISDDLIQRFLSTAADISIDSLKYAGHPSRGPLLQNSALYPFTASASIHRRQYFFAGLRQSL